MNTLIGTGSNYNHNIKLQGTEMLTDRDKPTNVTNRFRAAQTRHATCQRHQTRPVELSSLCSMELRPITDHSEARTVSSVHSTLYSTQ